MDFSAVFWEAEASKDAEIKFRNAFQSGCFYVLTVVAILEQPLSQQRKQKLKTWPFKSLQASQVCLCPVG